MPPDHQKGGIAMVTYPELIQFSLQAGLLIVGMIGLFLQANNKKK